MPNLKNLYQGSYVNDNGILVRGTANVNHALKRMLDDTDVLIVKMKYVTPLALGIAACGCAIGVTGKLLWDKVQKQKAKEQLALQQEPEALPEERTEYLEENQL